VLFLAHKCFDCHESPYNVHLSYPVGTLVGLSAFFVVAGFPARVPTLPDANFNAPVHRLKFILILGATNEIL
jgi:hypothetical protein